MQAVTLHSESLSGSVGALAREAQRGEERGEERKVESRGWDGWGGSAAVWSGVGLSDVAASGVLLGGGVSMKRSHSSTFIDGSPRSRSVAPARSKHTRGSAAAQLCYMLQRSLLRHGQQCALFAWGGKIAVRMAGNRTELEVGIVLPHLCGRSSRVSLQVSESHTREGRRAVAKSRIKSSQVKSAAPPVVGREQRRGSAWRAA
jgi:hypothetical protein